MNHEDYKEMLPLYSLGTVEEAEAREIEDHLKTCAECRAGVDDWRDTTSVLAYAAAPAEPSPELRSRILENVRSSNSQAATRKSGALKYETNKKLEVRSETAANVTRMPVRSWSVAQKTLAIAASLVFVALLASLYVVWSRNRALQTEVAILSRGLNETHDKLARLEQDIELLNAPTLAVATLKGTPMAQRAQGKLMYDQKTGRAIFMASDMPPAPPGKAYQLWYIAGTHVMPGVVFHTDAAGRATMRDQLPPEALNASVFAVTLEPASGVKAPTGEKYLLGPAI
jgi:anti-sigma-K factor RskA